jgi:hypothetical protein
MPLQRHLIVITATFIVAVNLVFLLDARTLDMLLLEDGPFEYLGALALLIAGVLFIAGYLRTRRLDPAAARGIWHRRSLLVLGLVFVVAAGEEISWGQRVFGVSTPESLAEVNVQQELNLHNLAGLSDVTLQLFIAGLYTFVVVIPFAAAANEKWASRLRRLVPIVPLRLSWLFILAYLVSQLAVLTFPVLAETRAHAFEAARFLDGLVGEVISALIVVTYPLNVYPNAEVRELVISVLAAYTGYVVFGQLEARNNRSAEARATAAA